ncbi:MAG: DinB family protein [Armatimonadota bacterium]
MTIPDHQRAHDTDLMKSMRMGVDECLLALRESYADLSDEEFRCFPLPDRHNIVTLVMHCLQQLDEYNGNLQFRRGDRLDYDDWHFTPREERFHLADVPSKRLPKPGDDFPSVTQVLALHDKIRAAMLYNMAMIPEEEFLTPLHLWPRLCDIFFRATYHTNAHVRQIWLLRGLMGHSTTWPEQHYA